MEKGVNRAIEDVRSLARGLLPLVGEKDSFNALLEEMKREMLERFRVECVIEAPRSFDIDDAAASTQLYYIISEALTNVAKHARARRVVITFHLGGDLLTAKIRMTAGIGDDAANSGGLGLSLMRHRARVIGGTLSVHNARNGGTEVVCKFRLKGRLRHERKNGRKKERAGSG